MINPIPISIVTPSYQQAAFLPQTIESVLSQNIDGLEYLIVDGGSTDGSLEIIKRYANRLAYWVSEKDSGQAEAINKGLKRVKGEIVAWINSDDYYLPGTFSFVINYFKEHPEIGLVYGDLMAVDENSRPFNLIRYQDWGLKGLSHFQIIGQPSVFFRKSVLDQVGFLDQNLHYLLDHQLWLRMAAITPMSYQPSPLAAARYHETAKNVANAAVFGEESFKVIEWMKTDPFYKTLWGNDQRQILGGATRLYAFYLAEGEIWQKAFFAYLASFRLAPIYMIKDWRRFLFTLFNLIGLKPLINLARNLRTQKRNSHLYPERNK